MAATNRRLEKVLSHMQAQTNSLSLQETAGQELNDNDVVIVRYAFILIAIGSPNVRLFGFTLPLEPRMSQKESTIAILNILPLLVF